MEAKEIKALPSACLHTLGSLPECMGLYFVVSRSGKVIYIGYSNNIKKRWESHQLKPVLKTEFGECRIYWMKYADDDICTKEKKLIDKYNPLLNGLYYVRGHIKKYRALYPANGKAQISIIIPAELKSQIDIVLQRKLKAHLSAYDDFISYLIESYLENHTGEYHAEGAK